LERKVALQSDILESIEDVNRILAADEEGKKLLWTTGYPHNLKPEVAERIQEALKKSPAMGMADRHGSSVCLPKTTSSRHR
jgi:hypothetical protein